MKTIAWDIWLYCNYDCKFCSTKTKVLPTKVHNIDTIFLAWKNIYDKYGKCKICITGGEPLLYPNIDIIIKRLSLIHFVHITTNLSMDINFLFDKNIDKDNIFINVTFHPYYADIYNFIQKILKIKKYEYKISVCYMNDNYQLTEFLNYKKIFKENAFDISLVSSINPNKNYKIIKNFIHNSSINWYNNYTVEQASKDKVCNAGINYACVDETGDAYSCSVMRLKLGNIFNNTFNFLKENVSCNKKCVIFENKY